MTDHLAAELRQILDDLHDSEHGDIPKTVVRERLERLADHVERVEDENILAVDLTERAVDADAELRTSRPTPRPPRHDDTRIGIAANAIGWELRHRDRDVSEHGDGNAQITVTADEAAADRTIAKRVIAHLDGYATTPVELEAVAGGLDPDQECRAQAARAIGWRSPGDTDLPDYHDWWWTELDRLAAYIRTGQRP